MEEFEPSREIQIEAVIMDLQGRNLLDEATKIDLKEKLTHAEIGQTIEFPQFTVNVDKNGFRVDTKE